MMCSVTILGARGSVPVSGSEFSRYGGATTCVLVRFGGQYIALDAGTGILSLPKAALRSKELTLLLSHPHADHLLGLPMCPYLLRPEAQLNVYAAPHGGLDAQEQVCRLLSPPLWPVGPKAFPASVHIRNLPPVLRLGDVTVDVLEGVHPGGVSVFRLEAGGKRVVFATDCSLRDDFAPRLAEFARGCDLLLCDGQYSQREWAKKPGYGHSSWTAAARLAKKCGAKRLRIIHHDPFRTDEKLDAAAAKLRAKNPDHDFAKEGEEIRL